ncbi:putative anonymous antigen-1 [Cryptosporidium felis]|nr:putative anonymous antigen-1 [Cryptosporidium felis]
MLLFSLRSLSDLCTPPTLLYKENSLDAMQRGVLAIMSEALQQFPDDEDISTNCIQILFGISEIMKESYPQDSELINIFQSSGGSATVAMAINGLMESNDSSIIASICTTIENLFQVQSIDAATAAESLGKFYESKYLGSSEFAKVTTAICSIAHHDSGALRPVWRRPGRCAQGCGSHYRPVSQQKEHHRKGRCLSRTSDEPPKAHGVSGRH